jgi:hypothetical protein
MAVWPEIVERRRNPPAPGSGVVDDLVLARPAEVVAWGTVDGTPWQIDAFVTAPGSDARWWEHGPVGPELAFFLGEGQRFGGGQAGTHLNDGTHLTASIHFFGSLPNVVAWVGVVSDEVRRLEVTLDDGDVRNVALHEGPAGFRRLFWFFPPRGATGRVTALASNGAALQSASLVDLDVHPRSNAGTSVNAFGHPVGRPPPGWPDDPTEYGPGEGPRHDEDFHLHETTFPLYVVPPDRWKGYVGHSGSGTSNGELDHVSFGYFDEPGSSRRGFEVINARPDHHRWVRPVRHEDGGIWMSDAIPDDDVANFASRFIPHEERLDLRGEFGFLDVGPTRIVVIVQLRIAGRTGDAHRREFRGLPSLRSIGFDLPRTQVTMLGWDVSFEELQDHARSLERLELGTELLRAMESAQARSDSRFQELHGHHHVDGTGG